MKKVRTIGILLALVLSLSLAGCSANPSADAAEHIYSHRGASGEETEHTFASYDLAIAYGSNYIEQDIVISKDGTIYVAHDLSAKKYGVDRPFIEMTDEEIDALTTSDGHHLLTLAQVFARYTDDVNFVIDLKDSRLVDQFIELVASCKYGARIVVQCGNPDILTRLSNEFPGMTIMFTATTQDAFDTALALDCVDIVSVPKSMMTREYCDLAHQREKQFNVYTLDTTEEITAAIELGVDTYFTNFTAKAFVLEQKYRSK